MKPESLKKIAEALGWTNVRISTSLNKKHRNVAGIPPNGTCEKQLNPQNNPAQLLEIIEYLHKHGILELVEIGGKTEATYNGYIYFKKSLTEAVLNAAEEFVK